MKKLLGLMLLLGPGGLGSAATVAVLPKPSVQVLQLGHPLAQGLVSFVGLVEGTGAVPPGSGQPTTTLDDAVSHGKVAYYKGSTFPATTPWIGSPYGYAVNFSDILDTGGAAQRIDYGGAIGGANQGVDVPQLKLTQMSVGVVIAIRSWTVAFGNIASRWVNSNADPFITYGMTVDNSNKIQACVANGGGGSLTCTLSGALTADVWYNFVMTYDKVTIRLYQDGVLVSSTAKSGDASTASARFMVGGTAETVGTQNFDGRMAVISVWNRPLAQNDVAEWFRDPWEVVRPTGESDFYAAGATTARRRQVVGVR